MKTKRQNGVRLWDIKPDLGISNFLWVYYTLLIYIYIYENYAKHTKQVVLGCASRAQTEYLAVTHVRNSNTINLPTPRNEGRTEFCDMNIKKKKLNVLWYKVKNG